MSLVLSGVFGVRGVMSPKEVHKCAVLFRLRVVRRERA